MKLSMLRKLLGDIADQVPGYDPDVVMFVGRKLCFMGTPPELREIDLTAAGTESIPDIHGKPLPGVPRNVVVL